MNEIDGYLPDLFQEARWRKLAAHFGLTAISISDDDEPDWWLYATTWILVTRNKEFAALDAVRDKAEAPADNRNSPLWTDDYASLYSIMK